MIEKRELTCINCPVGCIVTAELDDSEIISVSGNTCRRGEDYARAECIAPVRMVTGLVRVRGFREPLSVKTRTAIPKGLVRQCASILRATEIDHPVRIGDTVIEDICGSGVDIIATKSVG